MPRYRVTLEYVGTPCVGCEREDNGCSVQAAVEDAVFSLTGERVSVRGAGRTDAGVHALGQVAHFDTEAQIPVIGFQRGLNALLPRAIAVVALDEAAPDFDARFSARGQLYRYEIWNSETRSPRHD